MHRREPRYPLMSEIKQMYLNAYYGKTFAEKPLPEPVVGVTETVDPAISKRFITRKIQNKGRRVWI